MVSELQAANLTVLTTLCISQDKLSCEVVLCLVQPLALLLLHAPLPRSPLPANDYSRVLMVFQPLVGAAMGSSPKPATVTK